MSIRAIIDEVIATLRSTPHVMLESAEVLPGRTSTSLMQVLTPVGLLLPDWAMQLYAEVGGVHVSWRLEPAGYEALEPGRGDNGHRYDVSGNLDILSPETVCHGFTGRGWTGVYGEGTASYRPLEFASLYLSMGLVDSVSGQSGDPTILVLYDDRRESVGMTMAEYLRAGAELLFMNDWQLALLADGDAAYAAQISRLKSTVGELASWRESALKSQSTAASPRPARPPHPPE